MDAIGKLVGSFEDFLRYLASGVLALLAYSLVAEGARASWVEEHTASAAAVSVVVGLVAYTCHRAILYPFLFERIALWFAEIKPFKAKPEVLARDRARWRARGGDVEPGAAQATARGIGEWGTQVHFLYCAGYGLAAGLIPVTDWRDDAPIRTLVIVAAAFIVIGLIHNIRLKQRDLYVYPDKA